MNVSMLNWRNLMDEITKNEHWCFVSYQYNLKDDPTPHFGNINLPMTGHITDNDSFQVLNQFISQSITEDLKKHNLEIQGVPIILCFRELGV